MEIDLREGVRLVMGRQSHSETKSGKEIKLALGIDFGEVYISRKQLMLPDPPLYQRPFPSPISSCPSQSSSC